jgi:hypothetical protein
MGRCGDDDCAPSQVKFPCPDDLCLIEELGRGSVEPTMPTVRLYLVDATRNHDPLYGEPDPLYGEKAPEDDQIVGEHGRTWLGPFQLRGHLEFQETGPGGATSEPSELGEKQRVTGTLKIPRNELRKVNMVEAASEDRVRLPSEGDVVEIHARDFSVDPEGVGPYFFRIGDSSKTDQVGGTNYWTTFQIEMEMLSEFDPGREVSTKTVTRRSDPGSPTMEGMED